MTLIIPILAASFAAFCVWLTVRVVNRKERWAKWTLALTLGLPVLYVASFGPACWWFSRQQSPSEPYGSFVRHAPRFYLPMGWAVRYGDDPIRTTISWYATLRAPVVVIADGPNWIFMQSDPPTFE